MPVTDAYATAAEYRTAIGKTDTGQDADIDLDLEAVSRWLEHELGRFFTKDAGDVTRVYQPTIGTLSPGRPVDWAESENPYRWGGYSRLLSIDDLSQAPTSIKIDEDSDGSFADETALAATDYQLWPLNATLGPEPRPYTAILIPSWSTKSGWPAGKQVQVVGRFGWPAVPLPIKRGAIQLTGILRLETPRSTTRMNEMNQVIGVSREAKSIVEDLVRQYARGDVLV